jgi:pectate lyase
MRHPALIRCLLACVLVSACDGGGGDPGNGTAGVNGGAGTSGNAGSSGGGTSGGAAGNAGTSGGAGTSTPGTAGASAAGAGGTAGAGQSGAGGSGAGGTAGTGAGGATAGRGGAAGNAGSSAGAGGRGGAAGTSAAGAGGRGGAAGNVGSSAGAGGASSAGAGGRGGGAGTGAGGTAGTAGSTGAGGCANPPPAGPLVGWASLSGGTTGGGNATPQVVTTLQQFTTAVTGNTPAVIYVNGVLAPGRIGIGANKTIVGVCGAEIHGHLSVNQNNVIIRNIKIVGYGVGNCALDPSYDSSVGCSSGDDAVTVSGAQHVWFDHCDVSDGTDGNLDIVNGADFVTVSWTKFHYTPRSDNSGNDSTGANGHRFSNLIGSSDTVAADVGHLNITWDHDWWAENVNQRMPRSRRGKIHILNSLYTSTGNSYCSNAGQDAQLLIEGTVYNGVAGPLQVSQNGVINAPKTGNNANVFTNTSGSTTQTGTVFAPTYTYAVEPASGVQAAVMAGAGPK